VIAVVTAAYLAVLAGALAWALPPWQPAWAPVAVTGVAVAAVMAAYTGLAVPAAFAVVLSGRGRVALRLARLATSVPGAVVGVAALRWLAPGLGLGLATGALALAVFLLPYGLLLAHQAVLTLDPDLVVQLRALGVGERTATRLVAPLARPHLRAAGFQVAGRAAAETAVWVLAAGVAEHARGLAALQAGAATVAARFYYLVQSGEEGGRVRFLLATLLVASVVAELVALAARRAPRGPARGRAGGR
jgi:ABC-type phosphate transport system permease subunit